MIIHHRLKLTAAMVMALALSACGAREEAPRPVAAARGERLVVRQTMIADTKPVAATVATRDMAEARSRIGGVLTQLSVKEGDTVRRGQLIGRVVDQSLNFQTSALGAQVSAASAEAARAQADLARTADLYRNGVYAKARMEQVQAAARVAQGNLAAAQAQRSASASLGGQGVIVAPADGRVLKADTPAGSVVAPGQSVATLTAGPPVLRLEMPESGGRGLSLGQQVAVAAGDLPGVDFAVVTQIYPAISAGRVMIDLSAPGLRADFVGQRVRMAVSLGQRRALLIPRRFVLTRFGVDYVRVLDRAGGAGEVPVQITAGPAADQVEVLSGLAAGDTILAPGPAAAAR